MQDKFSNLGQHHTIAFYSRLLPPPLLHQSPRQYCDVDISHNTAYLNINLNQAKMPHEHLRCFLSLLKVDVRSFGHTKRRASI